MKAFEGPVVTVYSLEASGVELISSTHPDFDHSFGSGRSVQYDPILPYTVVIRNKSDREVIAHSVIWFCTGADGWVNRQSRTTFNFSTLQPGTNLPPHSSQVVSFLGDLEAGGHNPHGMIEAMNRMVECYSKQIAIRISLEAVLFDDGTAVGPDTGGWIDRWRAELDADKEVLTKSIQGSPDSARTVLKEYSEHALAIAREKGDQDFAVLPIMSERSTDYSECFNLMKGYFARRLLDEIEENSDTALERIRAKLKTKKYPNIKRKEMIP
jgi:hypothetical protein